MKDKEHNSCQKKDTNFTVTQTYLYGIDITAGLPEDRLALEELWVDKLGDVGFDDVMVVGLWGETA